MLFPGKDNLAAIGKQVTRLSIVWMQLYFQSESFQSYLQSAKVLKNDVFVW